MARCTVARLMRAMGLAGAVRGRAWVTTTHAGEGGRPVDLVDRRFVATRPNQLWVSDFTYVATWGGFVYVAFVIDVCARRMVAGGCRPPCARTVCWMRWSRRSTPAGATPSPASYITVMPGRRRAPSTVSRELRRNAATRSGGLAYRASTAQWHSDRRAKRPKIAKLAANDRLRSYVQDHLAGTVMAEDGTPVPGPNVGSWSGRRHGRRQDRHWVTSYCAP